MGDIVKIKFLRDGEPVFPVPTTINRNSTEEMLKEDITDALNEAQRRLEKHEQFRIVYTDEDGDNEVAIAVAVRRLVAFCLNTDLELYFAETEQKESGSHLISLRIDWKEVQRDVSCNVCLRPLANAPVWEGVVCCASQSVIVA